MRTVCCACGKPIRMSIILGNEGHELQGKAYACYDCCKLLGYGKGFFGAMGTTFITREQFVQEYNDAIARENQRKQDELEARRKIKEARQAKVDSVKKVISSLKNKIDGMTNEASNFVKNEPVSIDKLSDEELMKRMDAFIVKNPGMPLADGEKCFYQGACYSARLKNVVTGTSGNSVHIGGRGAFGMYMGSGTSQRNYDRRTISERYPGNFYITNNRMVCSAPKLAFEIKLTNITSLSAYSDALIITAKDKSHIVETQDVEIIKELLAINNEGVKRGLTTDVKEKKSNTAKTENNNNNADDKIIQLLREYKKLYDEGIITEEEFLDKKKHLLNR